MTQARHLTFAEGQQCLDANYWTAHVKGVGSGYWRFVASVEALEAKAADWKRQWLKGIGYPRSLVTG